MQGVWADPVNRDVAQVFQAWGVLEARHGTVQLARELFKCAIKADPKSEITWAVSACCMVQAMMVVHILSCMMGDHNKNTFEHCTGQSMYIVCFDCCINTALL